MFCKASVFSTRRSNVPACVPPEDWGNEGDMEWYGVPSLCDGMRSHSERTPKHSKTSKGTLMFNIFFVRLLNIFNCCPPLFYFFQL